MKGKVIGLIDERRNKAEDIYPHSLSGLIESKLF